MSNVTLDDLKRWKDNTLETALACGFDTKDIARLSEQRTVKINTLPGSPPENSIVQFGWCKYDFGRRKQIRIEIYEQPRFFKTIPELIQTYTSFGQPVTQQITAANEILGAKQFQELACQSGMDHELMGHGYHYLKKYDHGEDVACLTQIQLAAHRARTKPEWKLVVQTLPALLGQLKELDFLKTWRYEDE